MTDEYSIEFILDTYELPEKRRQRIAWIARDKYKNVTPGNFDQVYAYIAKLVDDFTRDYNARFYLSLDSEVTEEDKHSRQEYVAQQTCVPDEDMPYYEQAYLHARVERILEILQKPLGRAQYSFIANLMGTTNGHTPDMEPEEVTENAGAIKSRMDQLSDRYQHNESIRMPARPVKQIHFDPFSIQFQSRKRGFDPLAHFFEHEELYEGMTREQLRRFDTGLYNALYRKGLMQQAIPSTRPRRQSTNGTASEHAACVFRAVTPTRSNAYQPPTPTEDAQPLRTKAATHSY